MRVLFITANRIGDAVLTTGLYQHVVSVHPDARVTVACGPLASSLFRGAPKLDRVIELRKRSLARHWLALWRQVVTTRWDLVIDLRDSAVGRLIPARRRLIMTGALSRAPGLHKVEALGALFPDAPPPSPTVWLDERALETSREALAPLAGAPFLALAPTANWVGKEWSPDRFIATAAALTGPDGPLAGCVVAVFGAPGERERAAPILEALGDRGVDLIGRVDPLAVAACLARARLFIGNDSGLMHIAAAAGIPTLGLFGPGHPDIYGPWGPRAAVVVSTVPGEELRARVDRGEPPVGLMDGVSVDAVVDAARHLIARTG